MGFQVIIRIRVKGRVSSIGVGQSHTARAWVTSQSQRSLVWRWSSAYNGRMVQLHMKKGWDRILEHVR